MTISIPVVVGCFKRTYNILVDAKTIDFFAIHKSAEVLIGEIDEPKFTVTHLPTKCKVFAHDSFKTCEDFTNDILGLDWSFVNKFNDCHENCRAKYSRETAPLLFKDADKLLAIEQKYLTAPL
jgi:hypothetical protein